MLLDITKQNIREIIEKSNLPQDIINWLENHTGDISVRGKTPLTKNMIENSTLRFNNHIYDYFNANILGKDKDIILKNIYTEMNFLNDIFSDQTLCFASLDVNKHYNEWANIIRENTVPEITEIAKNMNNLEQSVIETMQYTNDSYLQAKDNLRDAEGLNELYQKDDKELTEIVDKLLEKEDNIEPYAMMQDIQKVAQDETIKDTITKEDFSKIIDLLQKDIEAQQQLLNFLQEDYLKKSSNTLKACMDAVTAKMIAVPDYVLKIKNDAANFCKGICVTAAGNLTNASYKASELYWDIKNKVSELNTTLNYNLACKLETLSLGKYSRFMQKMQTMDEKSNLYDRIYTTPGNNPAKFTNNLKMDISYHPTLKDKFAQFIMKNDKINYFALEQECWNGKSPVHKAEEEFAQMKEDIKEKFKNAVNKLDAFENMLGDKLENIVEKAEMKEEKFHENLKEFSARMTSFSNNIHNKILTGEAEILNTFSQNVIKFADKQRKKAEKYKNIDKVIYESETNIDKAIHSLNAIVPYQKKSYELSPVIQQPLEIINTIQTKDTIQNAIEIAKTIDDLTGPSIHRLTMLQDLLENSKASNEVIIDMPDPEIEEAMDSIELD